MNKLLIGLLGLMFAATSMADDLAFNVLTQDQSVVSGIRSENSDVWIKLAPAMVSESITVRISNRNKDFYRTWFNNSIDLVSTGYRGNDVWSDRVQTSANYIEYWMDDKLVLHLERK